MIPPTSVLFANLSQDYETQTRIADGVPDDEEFLRMMNVGAQVNTTEAGIRRSPPRNTNGTQDSSRIPIVAEEPQVTSASPGRKRKRTGKRGATRKRKRKTRGKNKPRFALNQPEQLKFNTLGQAVAPKKKVAQFSRYIGRLAADCSNFPINAKNWGEICKGGKLETVWQTVKASIDWSDPETLRLENDIKETVEDKLHERWGAFKCKLKKKFYKPFMGTELRLTCGNKHVHQKQWLELVGRWDTVHNQEVAKINVANRQELKMPHATGTTTYAQLRYEWELEHPGEVLDRVTFLKLVYTTKKKDPVNPQPINEEAKKKFDELQELETLVCSEGREITPEVRNELYYKVMGPEKRYRVRGYGVGVKWSDVPGIVTEKSGLTNRIQALNDAYEAQRAAHERREAEISNQLKESAERESKLQADFEALNKKMDTWQAQVGAHSLATILAAAGISSMESLDLGRLLNLVKKPSNLEAMSTTYLCQTASKSTDMRNVPNNGKVT